MEMKKLIMIILIVLLTTILASAGEFWNLRTTAHGTIVAFWDDHGIASGLGARFLFGPRDGFYDLGFEIEKWFRSYETFDSVMDSLINVGSKLEGGLDRESAYADNDQSGLSFSMLLRSNFGNLGSTKIYIAAGCGFYFIQHKLEDARQSTETGYWDVFKVDDYLETKFHLTTLLGVETELIYGFSLYLEGWSTYIHKAHINKGNDANGNPVRPDIWDHPYLATSTLGLRYNF
jgi:hypothetical protein